MAYAFTGSNYISLGTVSAFDLGLSAASFTLAFKFYRGVSGDILCMGKGGGFANWNATNGHQWVSAVIGGLFYWQIYNGVAGSPANITATAPSLATWTSCAVVYNGSITTLYTDAISRATSSSGYSQPSGANRAWIGNITSGDSNGARRLAEVAIWQNAALNAAEVAALHTGFTADQVRPQSLSFYAPLVRDLNEVRSGNALTNNGATVATHPRIIT